MDLVNPLTFRIAKGLDSLDPLDGAFSSSSIKNLENASVIFN